LTANMPKTMCVDGLSNRLDSFRPTFVTMTRVSVALNCSRVSTM